MHLKPYLSQWWPLLAILLVNINYQCMLFEIKLLYLNSLSLLDRSGQVANVYIFY